MPESRRHYWIQAFAIWNGVGILLILQTYVTVASDGRHLTPAAHLFTVLAQMYRTWIWALVTPFVFALRREIQRRHQNRLAVASLHLLAAVTLMVWVNIVRVWALELSFGYWTLDKLSLDNVWAITAPRAVIDFYIYWIVLVAAYLADLNWQKREAGLREEQLRTQLAQAEFAALKQQVQPHFLFNSLNAISSLMREGQAARAVEALALLSTLLRQLMAHAGRPEIELWRELDYAQCYLSVEKVRFEERLLVDFDAEEECFDALVPALILQPLVENAVKHGIAQRRNPGRVRVTAQRAGDRLHVEISNDPAEGGRHARESDSHGIGLRATRDRLQKAFGEEQQLDCVFNGPEGTKVTLELPLRFARVPELAVPPHG